MLVLRQDLLIEVNKVRFFHNQSHWEKKDINQNLARRISIKFFMYIQVLMGLDGKRLCPCLHQMVW